MQKRDAKKQMQKNRCKKIDAKNRCKKEMQQKMQKIRCKKYAKRKAMQQKVCIRKDPEMAQNCQHIFMTLGH